MKLPDFIIGGAPRSGTTWLYELLARHPRIHMARPKRPEPKFFLVDELYDRGLAYYSRTWFDEVAPGCKAGEKSTNYLENPLVAGRIHDAIPNVQLVFILRDPVARAISNYNWSRMNGLETEDFDTALGLEPSRERLVPESLKYARPHAYFSRGLYAEALEPFFARFARNQILCLRFEDIADDVERLACRLHRFLGVEPRPEDADLGVVNPSSDAGHHVSDETIERLRERYREPNQRLARLLGQDFSIWEDS